MQNETTRDKKGRFVRGHPSFLTREGKKKISLNNARYWFGKKRVFSSEHKKHLSESRAKQWAEGKRKMPKGKDSPNWKGGITKRRGYKLIFTKRYALRKKNIVGFFSFGEWEVLKKQYGYTCPSCKRREPEIKLTQDHIIPISKGGSHWIENIQPLCRSCNSLKWNKIIPKFLNEFGTSNKSHRLS